MAYMLTKDPTRVIDVTFGGCTFQASQITYANLLYAQKRLAREHPDARIVVIQPCWNVGVELSAGTHDKDAVLDVEIVGITWLEAQAFWRRCGFAAWWRHTGDWAARSDWHIHMISLAAVKAGCPVGIYIDGGLSQYGRVIYSSQVDDYYRHAEGLAGEHDSGDDPTWHPANIDATVFDYRAWLKQQEDDMPYTDWPEKDKKALADDVAAAVTAQVLNADMNANEPQGSPMFVGVTLREAIKSIFRAVKAQ